MKRVKGTLFALLLLSGTLQAQIHEKGNILVELNIGGPDWVTPALRAYYRNTGEFESKNITVQGSGVLVTKFEYLLTPRIGLGVMASYSGITVKFTDDGTNYTAKVSGIRVMPTFNVHMGKSKRFDPYFTLGIGPSFWSVAVETNDAFYKQRGYGSRTGLAIRPEFGLRYFITDHFGINVNLGLGAGSIIGLGVTGKF